MFQHRPTMHDLAHGEHARWHQAAERRRRGRRGTSLRPVRRKVHDDCPRDDRLSHTLTLHPECAEEV
jgi:hypothetical protein